MKNMVTSTDATALSLLLVARSVTPATDENAPEKNHAARRDDQRQLIR